MGNPQKVIDRCADVLDSRDVQARINHLTEEREGILNDRLGLLDEMQEGEFTRLAAMKDGEWLEEQGWDAQDELDFLEEMRAGAEDYCEWRDGTVIIADDYFECYAEEEAEECYGVTCSSGWPLNCIDWAKAAKELQQDYTEFEAGGRIWWVRAN